MMISEIAISMMISEILIIGEKSRISDFVIFSSVSKNIFDVEVISKNVFSKELPVFLLEK